MHSTVIGTSVKSAIRGETVRGRYAARIARNSGEIEAALRLRNNVFNVEMNGGSSDDGVESDAFDALCDHLIVTDATDGRVVGTYRLNAQADAAKYYSFSEFAIENLPPDLIGNAVEIGRACIDRDHRSTTVLFQLWKGLATYLRQHDKRYFFGCCSIFTTEFAAATATYEKLARDGFLHREFRVAPRIPVPLTDFAAKPAEIPPLMELYLRIGAKICGPPTIDREFGTIDFFVIFDIETIDAKYRRMFFS